MPFSVQERKSLLQLKGVGPTVLDRLEQIGISSCDQLKEYSVSEIVLAVAEMLGSSCWKNSPQAKVAIESAIEFASQSATGNRTSL
ncbi:MAG: helix-hairpin-helix domain-containing protein [Planctomycetota bacterium]